MVPQLLTKFSKLSLYPTHNIPPLFQALNKINLLEKLPSFFFKIHFNINLIYVYVFHVVSTL
jgi:hypothetical protein